MLPNMNSTVITYDTTVVTGLEKLAIREVEERIPDRDQIKYTVGHVFIKTKSRFAIMSRLQSVDNIYAVIYQSEATGLSVADQKKAEEIFEKILEECDWRTGLEVWKEASVFTKSDTDVILDRKPESQNKPSFRVSCNRTGKHKFTSQDACGIFGSVVNEVFHWDVSLKQFDLEILLTIKEDALIVALCLTKESLYKRHIVSYGVTTLRGTIAYNILQVANIQPGEIVCDPLCGSGVISVEGAINWPNTFSLAGDNSEVAIEKTSTNVAANQMTKSNIVQWDTTRLPIRSGVVDVFVTDLPFGKRMGSKFHNKTLYPMIVSEMIRCCRPQTGRIVMLTQDKQNANKAIHNPQVKRYCRLERSFFVKVGGLDSSIYLLKRNNVSFS